MDIIPGREWMYKRKFATGEYNLDFINGVDNFIAFAMQYPSRMDGSKIRCPCARCDNMEYLSTDKVKEHLVKKGFTKHYYDWRLHCDVEASSSSIPDASMDFSPPSNPYQHMLHDAWGQTTGHESYHFQTQHSAQYVPPAYIPEPPTNESYHFQTQHSAQYVLPAYMPEPPTNESQQFYNALEAAQTDLWAGCDYSELLTNARLMTLKSEHRMSQRAGICGGGISCIANKESCIVQLCMV